MAPEMSPSAPIELPKTPVPVKDFLKYLDTHPDAPISETVEPFKNFESVLRKVYAQQPDQEAVKDGLINLVPLFPDVESPLKVRARSLDSETVEEAEKYIMSLSDEDRKPNGSPAVVSSFKEFQSNFNLFSEASLVDMDFSNIVVAGSAVTTSLLPVPEKWAGSKRSLREYYHQNLAPASDVDIFLYGLDEAQAIEKIKQIERCVKDSILHETTTIRTKNAITIASQYPTRHVQIVLRLYDSISQIITGFDVDCACVAYTGTQVYAAPRAVAAFVTQINTIDLSRRSPSYENRLSKYSHRGFEVYWPLLDRSRVDPTIFERSFGRIQGLARLLVLEKLPKSHERDAYVDKRRVERGRPPVNRYNRYQRTLGGNIKDREEDDVAEWVVEDDISSYHTFTVPYGEKYGAAKINRLLYAKDLLLNSEWNKPDDREVNLHRHPCFFGTAEEVVEDCCGNCPIPLNDEEIEVAAEERKIYISGRITFLKDDPGRQEIGSFNPLTDDDWTEQAYVGNTARLCQAIVDGDLEHVYDWCSQEGVDVNRRDYCGRTPLHLACSVSTPEIVECLVDHGARLIARLFDGKTALHIAAARGSVRMIEILMTMSLVNEEKEDDRIEAARAARRANASKSSTEETDSLEDFDDSESLGSQDSVTQGEFVKLRIEDGSPSAPADGVDEEDSDDPDIYDVDVLAWDYAISPLHLAIINGHIDAMRCLVQDFGADPLLPVKLTNGWNNANSGVILPMILGMALPAAKAKEVVKVLIELGATASQADADHFSALQAVIVREGVDSKDFLDILLTHDALASLNIINLISADSGNFYARDYQSPLVTAISTSHQAAASKLLSSGAKPSIEFDEFVKAYVRSNVNGHISSPEDNMKKFETTITQPIFLAISNEMPTLVQEMLALNVDSSTLSTTAQSIIQNPQNGRYQKGETVLDAVRSKIKSLQEWIKGTQRNNNREPERLKSKSEYLSGFTPGTYKYWSAECDYEVAFLNNKNAWKQYEPLNKDRSGDLGTKEKVKVVTELIQEFEVIEKSLAAAGAKTFSELHPEIAPPLEDRSHLLYVTPPPKPWEPTFSFSVPDLDAQKRAAYMLLFEAVYQNDLDTVKEMTLGPWGAEKTKNPLLIAIKDGNGFSPFSLATCRGHLKLARVIIDIALAQYQPELKPVRKYRWNLRPDDSDYESDAGSDEINIYQELVDDVFTVDVISAVSNTVKSTIRPLTMIEFPCKPFRLDDSAKDKARNESASLLKFAILNDDMALLNFILQVSTEQSAYFAESEGNPSRFTIDQDIFYAAIAKGRTQMLGELIKSSGVGISLHELVNSSGVTFTEKPRYYQGLNVGGKKRIDWAQAGGPHNHEVSRTEHPPLLVAAHHGRIESVEWFMSDAPARYYREWAATNKNDERVKVLEQSEGGFQGAISRWLMSRNDLTLHCAILNSNYNRNYINDADWNQRYIQLIEYLLTILPSTHLEKKSSQGLTPLMIATVLRKPSVIKLLISAGASQRARDKQDRNAIHLLLEKPNLKASKVKEILDCFDKDALKQMMLERCKAAPTALTPLALWLSQSHIVLHYSGNPTQSDQNNLKVLKVLTEYSSGEEFEMLNGEGDLPLHVSVKKGLASTTSHLLALRPDLLHRENSTGRTSLEMASDIYLRDIVSGEHGTQNAFFDRNNRYYNGTFQSVIHKQNREFAPKEVEEEKDVYGIKETYDVCVAVDDALKKEKGAVVKRRLVSLNEANEVARRLAASKGESRKVRSEDSGDGKVVDEVKMWMQ